MKAATHIVGGYVFAGTLCSFTDVNIFENRYYIVACTLFSVLPDIDTTKSLLGKLFYPVAWILSRKFGHRTITHSLVFLAFVWLVFFILQWFGIVADANLSKIALFALVSHFVFDMITVSGVPLLYPFFRNACVIPGNVNFRFNTNDLKSDLIVSGVCGLLCFTMQPLFADGFWTTYNRQFGTIRHVDRENRNTAFYVICDYSYILNAETFTGNALVIDSKFDELILFDSQQIFTLNSENPQLKINYVRPRISDIEKRFEEIQFFNIDYDSLQMLLSGRLSSGLIQSNVNVRYIDNAITYFTNFIRFTNRFDFHVYAGADSVKTSVITEMARLEASINQSLQRHRADVAKYREHHNAIRRLEDILKSDTLSLYERNRNQRELIRLRGRTVEQPVYNEPSAQIAELNILRNSMTDNILMFSGYVTLLTFGVQSSESDGDIPAVPRLNYSPDYLFANLNRYEYEE